MYVLDLLVKNIITLEDSCIDFSDLKVDVSVEKATT